MLTKTRHFLFFFNDTATTEIYTLSLHDALPISKSSLIDRFHSRHPGLRVEFVTSDRYLDLSKGEVDVAFRSGDTDDELVGRKIADSIWAVYASRTYVERHGQPARVEDLPPHPPAGFDA